LGRAGTPAAREPVIRLLIADDQALMREGLRVMLSPQPDIEGGAEAATGRELVDAAATARADVALVDIRMPGMDGIAATRELQRSASRPRGVILTTFDHADHV